MTKDATVRVESSGGAAERGGSFALLVANTRIPFKPVSQQPGSSGFGFSLAGINSA